MVPIVDISPFVDDAAYDDESRRRVAVEWDMAMTNVGFAIIAGHGVHPRTITELRNGALDFFAMDASTKVAYDHGPYGIPLGGYTGVGIEAVSRTRDVHGSDGGGGRRPRHRRRRRPAGSGRVVRVQAGVVHAEAAGAGDSRRGLSRRSPTRTGCAPQAHRRESRPPIRLLRALLHATRPGYHIAPAVVLPAHFPGGTIVVVDAIRRSHRLHRLYHPPSGRGGCRRHRRRWPAGIDAKGGVDGGTPDARDLRGEYRRPVRGLDERSMEIDGTSRDEAPSRFHRGDVAPPVHTVLHRTA